jgi:hypothetical protein
MSGPSKVEGHAYKQQLFRFRADDEAYCQFARQANIACCQDGRCP